MDLHKTTVNLSTRLHDLVVKRALELNVPKSAIVSICVEEYFKNRGELPNENSKSKN